MATGVSITPNSLEACHRLLSNQNDKVIIKFSRRKGAEMFLSKNKKTKNKDNGFKPRNVGIESGKVFINESLCHYYKFLWSICKHLWSVECIEAFWVNNYQIKISELNLKVQNLELLTSQISRNYFQAKIFSLNEIFLLYLVILCRSFCSYICRIHAKTGRGALPVLGCTSL